MSKARGWTLARLGRLLLKSRQVSTHWLARANSMHRAEQAQNGIVGRFGQRATTATSRDRAKI